MVGPPIPRSPQQPAAAWLGAPGQGSTDLPAVEVQVRKRHLGRAWEGHPLGRGHGDNEFWLDIFGDV